MKSSIIFLMVLSSQGAIFCFAQKKISDFSIVYDYEIVTTKSAVSKPISGTNSLFVKGSLIRTEMGNQAYLSATIHDGTTGNTVILKEVSGQKILIRLTPQEWKQINTGDDHVAFTNSTETKTIAGYKCIMAVAQAPDGSRLSVYYTNELSVDNPDYNPLFRNLGGLPLEYELAKGDYTIRYTVLKLNLNPVPASKFDVPKTGFREMTFEESKKLNSRL